MLAMCVLAPMTPPQLVQRRMVPSAAQSHYSDRVRSLDTAVLAAMWLSPRAAHVYQRSSVSRRVFGARPAYTCHSLCTSSLDARMPSIGPPRVRALCLFVFPAKIGPMSEEYLTSTRPARTYQTSAVCGAPRGPPTDNSAPTCPTCEGGNLAPNPSRRAVGGGGGP